MLSHRLVATLIVRVAEDDQSATSWKSGHEPIRISPAVLHFRSARKTQRTGLRTG